MVVDILEDFFILCKGGWPLWLTLLMFEPEILLLFDLSHLFTLPVLVGIVAMYLDVNNALKNALNRKKGRKNTKEPKAPIHHCRYVPPKTSFSSAYQSFIGHALLSIGLFALCYVTTRTASLGDGVWGYPKEAYRQWLYFIGWISMVSVAVWTLISLLDKLYELNLELNEWFKNFDRFSSDSIGNWGLQVMTGLVVFLYTGALLTTILFALMIKDGGMVLVNASTRLPAG
ncbi:hypothetical protein LCL85_15480 [Vibrio alginolyticus]|nr:hypothetical protein [Vibrio alginolyticus]